MSLGASDRRMLASIEDCLAQTDPELAARFADFGRVAARRQAARPVMQPALPVRSVRRWHRSTAIALVMLVLMLAATAVIVLVPHVG